MSNITVKLVDGEEIKLETKFEIGDYVNIVYPGCQYSRYDKAFKYFWGNDKNYYILCADSTIWKVINMAFHPSNGKIIYHIRTVDGKNAVVSGGALKKIEYHKRNRKNIHPIMIYQLCINPMPHSWKEKLYKVLDEDNVSQV